MVEQAIDLQHDMEVVAHCASLDDMLESAEQYDPDIVVVEIEDTVLPRACLDVMLEHPGVSILGLEARGTRAWLCELRLEQVQIDEVAPSDVVDSIRNAARRHTTA